MENSSNTEVESDVSEELDGVLVYPSLGMLEKESSSGDPIPVRYAYAPLNSIDLVVRPVDGEDMVFEDPMIDEQDSLSFLRFSVDDQVYMIRRVNSYDGVKFSKYQTPLPAYAVKALITDENHQDPRERSPLMAYFADSNEEMVALANDEGRIVAIVYINGFGMYMRNGATWVAVPAGDDAYDMATPYSVNKETVEDLLTMFDSKLITVDDASQYLTPIE